MDVVIAAGDIHEGILGPGWLRSLYRGPIIYTPGNHEYYGHRLDQHDKAMREECTRAGVHFLQCSSVEIKDVLFLGCTLWTDFAAFEPRVSKIEAGGLAEKVLADYDRVLIRPNKNETVRKIRWNDTTKIHAKHRKWLATEITRNRGRNMVVVTHHPPSLSLGDPGYTTDPTTAAFCNRMNDLVKWAGEAGVRYWVCGHSHYANQVRIGKVIVVNNAAGSPEAPNRAERFSPELVLDL
jgi:hypothetical protein